MIKQAQTVYVPVSVPLKDAEWAVEKYDNDADDFYFKEYVKPQQSIILSPDEWEKVKKCVEVLQEIVDADNMVLLNSHNIKANESLSQLTELK